MATVVIKTIASSSTARIVSGGIDLAGAIMEASLTLPISRGVRSRPISNRALSSTRQTDGVFPGPTFLARRGVQQFQSSRPPGTRSEVPPQLLAIVDEVIVARFAGVHVAIIRCGFQPLGAWNRANHSRIIAKGGGARGGARGAKN